MGTEIEADVKVESVTLKSGMAVIKLKALASEVQASIKCANYHMTLALTQQALDFEEDDKEGGDEDG